MVTLISKWQNGCKTMSDCEERTFGSGRTSLSCASMSRWLSIARASRPKSLEEEKKRGNSSVRLALNNQIKPPAGTGGKLHGGETVVSRRGAVAGSTYRCLAAQIVGLDQESTPHTGLLFTVSDNRKKKMSVAFRGSIARRRETKLDGDRPAWLVNVAAVPLPPPPHTDTHASSSLSSFMSTISARSAGCMRSSASAAVYTVRGVKAVCSGWQVWQRTREGERGNRLVSAVQHD